MMPRHQFLSATLLLVSLAGCSEADSQGNRPSPTDLSHNSEGRDVGSKLVDDVGRQRPTTEGAPDGPTFLELSVTPPHLTPTSVGATITAIVTDPQGFGDIGGGRLLTRDGESIQVFVGSGGSFQAAVSWHTLAGLMDITFEEELEVTLIAEFFDAANHRTRGELILTLHCDGEPACKGSCGEVPCEGQCWPDTTSFAFDPNHCGGCGIRCGGGTECFQGVCHCPSGEEVCGGSCVDTDSDPLHCGACNRACGEGMGCISGTCRPLGRAFQRCDGDTVACGEVASCAKLHPDLPYPVCYLSCTTKEDCPGSNSICAQQFCVETCSRGGQASCPDGTMCIEVPQEYLGAFGVQAGEKLCGLEQLVW